MKEIWKPIKNFEEYQVSNLGRVKSLKFGREKILKFKKDKGYLRVGLFNKTQKNVKKLVNVLVAEAFISKKNFKYTEYDLKDKIKKENLEVNHKDGNKENNCVDNLEWCTKSYNQKHSYVIGLKKPKRGYENNRSRKIIQYDLKEKYIKEWANKREIERILNYNNGNITACCRKEIKTAYGFIWKYKED